MTLANYCLRGDLSEEMQVTDPNEDARLDRAITDASRAVDAFCRQEPGTFAAQTLTKVFDVWGTRLEGYWGSNRAHLTDNSRMWTMSLDVPPLLSVTTLSTDENSDGIYDTLWTSVTDYLLYPRNAEVKRRIDTNSDTGRRGFPNGQAKVQIVGSWGITEDGATPLPIRRATLLLAMNYYRRPSTASTSQGLGGAAVQIGYADIDVAAILWEVSGKYREQWIGAA